MRRLRPAIVLRPIATRPPRGRRDPDLGLEAFARLAAASGPWTVWPCERHYEFDPRARDGRGSPSGA
jgi:hypothetical protein